MYDVTSESYFEVTEEGVLVGFSEKGYKEKPVNIVIPEQIDGIEITSIGEYAFDTKSVNETAKIDFMLESVVIPPSVTRIEKEAFSNNSLKELTLPSKLEFIGRHAFDNSKLTSLVIPNNVKRIDYEAFYGNPLSELVLGNNLEFIGNMTFYNNNLETIKIPTSVKTIDALAFIGKKIPKVIIPEEYSKWKSTRTIDEGSFVNGAVFKVE